MIDIVRASFNFDTPAPTEDQLIAYARRIFDEMDAAVEEFLPFNDYSLYLAVQEGSVKGLGKVAVAASALYVGIAQYGSFIQGVEIIKRQGCAVAEAIVSEAAKNEIGNPLPKKHTRVDAGAVSRLERLFVKVRDREIAPEEATLKALQVLDPTGAELPPEAQQEIAVALESLETYPEQLSLDLGIEEEFAPSAVPIPRPKRPIPIEQHLLVVIERKKRRSEPRLRKKYL
ncbi:hypothetical protein GEOBRER4_n3730 [Citrifermentans bremense]|uniref:Uncharacterized protein n=2 Tax=Citrifermentans bremense TaxID=60035 RepID=A0A7R7IZF8_9BACT|nr:hypothetical protein [Citrifermentans bremense]BCO11606.1 hypothetical protein GEOBRER4_n3730 [Citrifermentans bremense]